MKHKVAELEGALLDAAVAKAEGYSQVRIREAADRPVCEVQLGLGGDRVQWVPHGPSREWSVGGPIIEREEIELRRAERGGWHAGIGLEDHHERAGIGSFGPTPLIAAMRAYVASKFGEEVELP